MSSAYDILPHVPQRTPMSLSEIAHKAKMDGARVRPLLRYLVEEGLVVVKGKARGTRYQRVATATVELAAFPLPKEIGNYFAIGTEFKSMAEHFGAGRAKEVPATVWRAIQIFKVHGLLEVHEEKRGSGNPLCKRAEQVRRKFRSVTFRDDGTVVFA